jgi:endonuclease/exonuclease/phosphatase family metal-dependent hydrolase
LGSIATVATYNMLHGLDLRSSGRLDLGAVGTAIAQLGADVVALQEVDRHLDRSGGVDQVAWLAERLGWHGVFAPALLGDPERSWTRPDGPDRGGPSYGVGIVSRFPVAEWRGHPLPGGGDGRRSRPAAPSRPGWDREPRVALTATVLTGHGPLPVTTTHLSYLPWRGVRQLRAVARFAAGSHRAVLLGDLNLPPAAVRLALPGWDHHAGPPTYPVWEPRMRIDHLVSRGMAVRQVRVAGATSDHLALLAELGPA